MSANCPECDSAIDVDEFYVDIGEELTCSECGSLLRVANDSPLEFDIADDDDDIDDDDDEDEKDDGEESDDDDDDEDEDDDDRLDDE